ncbi:hypothetical protein [Grimontia indica]|uniref:hypothetical protein n=1 Tax=Grimontia indica TaxID=1056512 RepID=UPI0005874AE9|nr:hypothetical protein [Grimontia indica]
MQTASIDKFPLKWRWTEEEYCLLSQDELAQITPLSQESAKEVWETSLKFASDKNDFSPNNELFTDISSIEAIDQNKVREWLANRLPKCDIIVSWQPDTAVLTNTDLFIQYWDDFCYGASDDVSVWPKDKSWVLHYWHEEVFWHGKSASV